ncbi:energy transducer TonB [uncultured Hyphomonas sp.]|uniref:energy transducer TonB family protein n=1 Tax=uncultured Hyphomonas sp. TaxID=225298 RepID=UPI003747B7B0
MIRVGVAAGASMAFHLAVFAAAGSGSSSTQMPRNSAEIRIGHPPGHGPATKAAGSEPETMPASMRAPDPEPPQPAPTPAPPPQPEPPPRPVKPKPSPIAQAELAPTDIAEVPPASPPTAPVPNTAVQPENDQTANESAYSGSDRSPVEGTDASSSGGASNKSASNEGASGTTGEASASTGSGASDAGDAASTNYAGLVMLHLSKVRRPRASSPGSAFVSFTIGFQGQLEELRIVKSSRSARFDRDAMKVVRRATPFPVPPPGVNRSFSVEIEGS